MIVTEQQARQLWCPFARVSLPSNAAGNRVSTFHKQLAAKSSPRDAEHYEQQEADCKCIASGCMAWRWGNQHLHAEGFCGLAGSAS